jgi:hypothetical protein
VGWNGSLWLAGGDGDNKLVYSYDGINWTSSTSLNLFTTSLYTLASRRVLPWTGTTSNHFQAGPTGPTGSAAVGDYFINTTNQNLYAYAGTSGPTGPPVWNSIMVINVPRLGRVLTVDSVNGNNTTAQRGANPFATIEAAIAVAQSGDTIWVLPGTHTLSAGITIPAGTSLTGISTQTTTIQMLGVTANTTLITMGENTRLENVTMKLTSATHYTLTGLRFPGTTSVTAKLRTCVLTLDNSGASFNGLSDVTGVLFDGSGSLTSGSFSFNSLKGSTINVYSNGAGLKRGVLVNNTNVSSSRDMNIYVARPTSPGATGATGATGSYVGIETHDPSGNGSIQLRATTVGIVKPTAGNSYTASDILQTTPTTITDPTYLASPGIQLGPGTDLVTKSAGSKGFSSFIYPTTVFYCIKGVIGNNDTGYLWPGTVSAAGGGNPYPDITTPAARFRIQQPTILSGMSASCNGITSPNTATITVCKNASTGGSLSNPTVFTLTLSSGTLNASFYNGSVDFATGDNINVYIAVSGNTVTDVAVQLDLF